MSASDLTFARDGSNLVIEGPNFTYPGTYGDYTIDGGGMVLSRFFAHGLDHVSIDGTSIDVSGLI